MQFILQAGLLLKHGSRVLQLVRELPVTAEFQLEDTLTKAILTIKRSRLIDAIYKREYDVIVEAAQATESSPVSNADRLFDVNSLTPKQRIKLEQRLEFVKELDRKGVTRGQRSRVSTIVQTVTARLKLPVAPSTTSVMNWARKYQGSGNNAAVLIDGHRWRKSPLRIAPTLESFLWETLKAHYFNRNRYSLRHAYDQLQRRIKVAIKNNQLPAIESAVSYPTFARRVQAVDLYHRVASREGANRARMVCRVAFPEGVAEYPLQRVEIDHTPLNWVVICDRTGLPLGRPIITLMIDAYSGYVLGFYICFYPPGATSLCGVVRNAIMPKDDIVAAAGLTQPWLSYGLADEFVVDNGMEFHSFAFKTISMTLGIDITYSRVRTPWFKPHVERFFSSLNTLTLMRGRVSAPMVNVARVDPYKDACILFTDLVQGLLKYIVDVHSHSPNWRKMATPHELFSAGIQKTPPAVFPGSLEALRLASGMSKYLTLGPGGIELYGLPYGSYAFKDIVNRHGSRLKLLCKWDPDDMSSLYVQSPDGSTWHEAQCRWAEYAQGLSFNQHQMIRKYGRAELTKGDRLDDLLNARQDLHEHWLNATSRRKRADALAAARYANLTSSKVFAHTEHVHCAPPASTPRILIETDLAIEQSSVIPSFESFLM